MDRLRNAQAADLALDRYGVGGAVAALERRSCELFGAESALFFAKGTLAQLCALRVWSDRSGHKGVAVHRRSHLELDEEGALEMLHPIVPLPVGPALASFDVDHVRLVTDPLAAVCVELPVRRAAFALLPWTELVRLSEYCRTQGVALHIDGARIWESAYAYGRTLPEIMSLSDSMYVSFYKSVGAFAGAMLLGSADLIDAARTWRTRHGGVAYTNFATAIGALDGLERYLPNVPAYCRRAGRLAAAFQAAGLRVAPDPPGANTFVVYLPCPVEALREAHSAFAARSSLWLFHRIMETELKDASGVEFMIGDAAEQVSDNEILDAVGAIVSACKT